MQSSSPELTTRLTALQGLPYKWLALSATAIAAFLGPLEGNLIIVSLPTMRRAFDLPAASVVWVMVAATLVTLGLTLPIGSLSDNLGRRRLYTLGFGIFIAGAAIAYAAPTFQVLLGARVLQGIGTALFASTRNAVATEAMPAQQRGLAMGVIISSVALGASTAPFLGGWLVEAFGWRAIFAAEIPVALLAGLFALTVLKPEGPTERRRAAFDLPGALFIFGALGALLLAGNRLPSLGATSPLVLGLGAAGLLLLALFLWREPHTANPVLDFSLFRNRAFTVPTVALVLQSLAFATAGLMLPFFLEEALGLSSLRAGSVFALSPITMFFGGLAGGVFADRLGARRVMAGALALNVAGVAALATLTDDVPLLRVIVPLIAMGAAAGAFQTTASSAQLGAVPPNRLGTASAIFIAIIMLSLSTGTSMGGTLLTARVAIHEAALGPTAAVAAAYREIALAATIFLALALATVLARGGRRTDNADRSS